MLKHTSHGADVRLSLVKIYRHDGWVIVGEGGVRLIQFRLCVILAAHQSSPQLRSMLAQAKRFASKTSKMTHLVACVGNRRLRMLSLRNDVQRSGRPCFHPKGFSNGFPHRAATLRNSLCCLEVLLKKRTWHALACQKKKASLWQSVCWHESLSGSCEENCCKLVVEERLKT